MEIGIEAPPLTMLQGSPMTPLPESPPGDTGSGDVPPACDNDMTPPDAEPMLIANQEALLGPGKSTECGHNYMH